MAACGSSTGAVSANPKTQLLAGAASIQAQPTLAYNVHLASTPAQLGALAPSLPTPYDSVVAGASLVIQQSTTNGKPLSSLGTAYFNAGSPSAQIAELKNEDVDISFNAGGFKLIEIRLVNGVLYARADVHDALGLFGLNQSELAPYAAKIPVGSQYDFARAALAGNWVSFNFVTVLQGLASSLPVTPTTAKGEFNQVITSLKAVYNNDVSVVKDGSAPGSSTKLAVSANEQTVVRALLIAFSQVEARLGTGGKVPAPDLSKVPSKTVTAFAGLSGNTLNNVAFNASQFIPTATAASNPLELEVGVSHPTVSISAPSGATAISLPGIAKLFSGLPAAAKARVSANG